jgi:hypothetical protein
VRHVLNEPHTVSPQANPNSSPEAVHEKIVDGFFSLILAASSQKLFEKSL